jgi:aryl-alcohol dehydrogenase-like predicted oxidoreductase
MSTTTTLAGRATPEGTRAFAEKHADLADDFYSLAHGLKLSSLGLGTYLGDDGPAVDQSYEDAILAALEGGINHLDTAVNYRGMASERALGRALGAACRSGLAREGVLVATKGGYIPHDVHQPSRGGRALVDTLLKEGKVTKDDLALGSHCLAPRFVESMVATSLSNLGLACLDIYYLHNPESQLSAGVEKPAFYARCRAAFEVLEDARKKGTVAAYGAATWNGFRRPVGAADALSLEKMVEAARAAAGSDDHGFKWIQLPVNLGLPEALIRPTQEVSGEAVPLVEAARRLGVAVIASGTIGQGELAQGLRGAAARARPLGVLGTNAQRAIQCVRSGAGITTALVGMSKRAHVRENLAVSRVPKLEPKVVEDLFRGV